MNEGCNFTRNIFYSGRLVGQIESALELTENLPAELAAWSASQVLNAYAKTIKCGDIDSRNANC